MKPLLPIQKKMTALRGRAVCVHRRLRRLFCTRTVCWNMARSAAAMSILLAMASIGHGGTSGITPVFARYAVISGKETTPAMQASVRVEALPTDVQYPVQGRLTTRFSRFHPGIDLAISYGTEIYPYGNGLVVETRFDSIGLGRAVVVDHGDGLVSEYGHLSVVMVQPGDTVTLHTVIGEIGSTGYSTGSHLHFEIREDAIPVDPLKFLPDYDA